MRLGQSPNPLSDNYTTFHHHRQNSLAANISKKKLYKYHS